MRGAYLIQKERERQIEEEGYTDEHDLNHNIDDFVKAAISYAIVDLDKEKGGDYGYAWWPWEEIYWKPKDRKRNLVRAGALIAAAIDRLENEELEIQ